MEVIPAKNVQAISCSLIFIYTQIKRIHTAAAVAYLLAYSHTVFEGPLIKTSAGTPVAHTDICVVFLQSLSSKIPSSYPKLLYSLFIPISSCPYFNKICYHYSTLKMEQQVPPKPWYLSTTPHGLTPQTT